MALYCTSNSFQESPHSKKSLKGGGKVGAVWSPGLWGGREQAQGGLFTWERTHTSQFLRLHRIFMHSAVLSPLPLFTCGILWRCSYLLFFKNRLRIPQSVPHRPARQQARDRPPLASTEPGPMGYLRQVPGSFPKGILRPQASSPPQLSPTPQTRPGRKGQWSQTWRIVTSTWEALFFHFLSSGPSLWATCLI